MKIKEGQIYKHFKGELVKIICIAKNSETEEPMVIYNHLSTGEIWARPLDMFISLVDTSKYPEANQKYRFELVKNDK